MSANRSVLTAPSRKRQPNILAVAVVALMLGLLVSGIWALGYYTGKADAEARIQRLKGELHYADEVISQERAEYGELSSVTYAELVRMHDDGVGFGDIYVTP